MASLCAVCIFLCFTIMTQCIYQAQSQIPEAPANASIIYHSSQPLSLHMMNQITTMEIAECLYIGFDIKLLSTNNTNLQQQILKITSGNNDTLINIFLMHSSLQFDNIINFSLLLNLWYNISIYKTDKSLKYWINKQLIYENNHDQYTLNDLLFTNVSLHIGNYMINDITIKNLYIWTSHHEQNDIYLSQMNTTHIKIIILGLICGFILCITIIVVIVFFHCVALRKQQRLNESNLRFSNWQSNVSQQTLQTKSIQESINLKKQSIKIKQKQATNDEINISEDLNDNENHSSEQSLKSLKSLRTKTSNNKHMRKLSVEFEDIHNIGTGMSIPAYISNDDESESSTFTASSTAM